MILQIQHLSLRLWFSNCPLGNFFFNIRHILSNGLLNILFIKWLISFVLFFAFSRIVFVKDILTLLHMLVHLMLQSVNRKLLITAVIRFIVFGLLSTTSSLLFKKLYTQLGFMGVLVTSESWIIIRALRCLFRQSLSRIWTL